MKEEKDEKLVNEEEKKKPNKFWEKTKQLTKNAGNFVAKTTKVVCVGTVELAKGVVSAGAKSVNKMINEAEKVEEKEKKNNSN